MRILVKSEKVKSKNPERCRIRDFLEAPPGIGPGIRVLQTRALPLGHGAIWSGLRGSNPPPRPWQGRALPNELNPHSGILNKKWCLRSESNQRHGDFQSPALPTELQRHNGRLQSTKKWRPGTGSNRRPLA